MTYHSEKGTMDNCNNVPEFRDTWPTMRYSEAEPDQTEPSQTEPDPLTIREQLLQDVSKIITGDRNREYGEPDQNIGRTYEMLRAYLGSRSGLELEPEDVCAFAIILKLGRLSHDSSKRDTWMDIAGYAAVGWEVVEKNRI